MRQAMDLEILAPILRQAGHEVRLAYDPDVFGVTDNVLQSRVLARLADSSGRIFREVRDYRPDVCIFSVLPATHGWCREMAGRIKRETGCTIVFAGLHPTLVPERVLRDAIADFVVQGEMENSIPRLLGETGAGGDKLRTSRHERVDLDALPIPDKDLFKPWVSHAYSYATMVSRGCPFRCSYCEETCQGRIMGPGYFRRKSVDSVMRELVEAKRKYSFREVIFKDSYLTGDNDWLAALMERFRSEIGVPFKCFCTISGFDGRTAGLLKQGGCYCVEFGLQTWNDAIRRKVLDRVESSEAARAAFESCADHGLWYDVDHMLGLPGETEEDHRLGAVQYGSLRRLNRIKVHHLVLLPGAPIIDDVAPDGAEREALAGRLADGVAADFYRAGGRGAKDAAGLAYAKLYKMLPALHGGALKWLLEGRRARLVRFVPAFMVIFVQALLAVRSRDLRFAEYLRHYPARVIRAIFWK